MVESVLYETPAAGVARLTLNRPASRNAQDTRLLYELNDAYDRAARDDAVKVVILAAEGPHFSSGHDLRESPETSLETLREFPLVGTWAGFEGGGAEGQVAREKEVYLGFCERWRNFAKPTIAQVQGKCIAGGLMLVWPCDLIVAASDALFMDNTVAMGGGGVEYFAHPWELGWRKAKEFLFVGDFLSAEEALRVGMVNHVVPPEQLAEFTLGLAEKIARQSGFVLKLVKEAVNLAQDAQGRTSSMQAAFALHQLAHSHNYRVHGLPVDPNGVMIAVGAATAKPK